jgi:hypothetical protein
MTMPNETRPPTNESPRATRSVGHTKEEFARRTIERTLRSKSEFFERALRRSVVQRHLGRLRRVRVLRGTSMWLAWQEIVANPVARHMWAVDSFSGLPETDEPRDEHPAWIPSTMSMSVGDFHAVLATRGVPRDGYTTVEGYFAESLPPLGPTVRPGTSHWRTSTATCTPVR